MVKMPRKKVGLISCSGEDLPEGTISRIATLKVLESLRPKDTVTLCLPLFLAGDEKERAFARIYPTIAIDGCERLCATRATAKYSAQPVATFVVSDIIEEQGFSASHKVRNLDENGKKIVSFLSNEIALKIDELLGKKQVNVNIQDQIKLPSDIELELEVEEPATATCSCGVTFPSKKIIINNKKVDVIALPVIFEIFSQEGKSPEDEIAEELMEKIKIYNRIPEEEENIWKQEILKEYKSYVTNLS